MGVVAELVASGRGFLEDLADLVRPRARPVTSTAPVAGAASAIVLDHAPPGRLGRFDGTSSLDGDDGHVRGPLPVVVDHPPPKFTDIGKDNAEQKEVSADVKSGVGAALSGLGVPGAGLIGGVVGGVAADFIVPGNAAGLSPQQLDYINKNPNNLPVGQLLAQVEGRDGSKLIQVGGEDVRTGGNSGRVGAAADAVTPRESPGASPRVQGPGGRQPPTALGAARDD